MSQKVMKFLASASWGLVAISCLCTCIQTDIL